MEAYQLTNNSPPGHPFFFFFIFCFINVTHGFTIVPSVPPSLDVHILNVDAAQLIESNDAVVAHLCKTTGRCKFFHAEKYIVQIYCSHV